MKKFLMTTVAVIGFCGLFVNAQARTAADLAEALRVYDAAPDGPDKPRLAAAVDAAAAQKDAVYSRLYWHTDLAEALAEARATHRPVLSLRLLGRLDEELSCANSRFFRTTLYANGKVADLLRNHFVLHWESVRPAPKLTVDYGDGRTLVTTITGNSVHYVLDEEGTVIDALPGLYSPTTFTAKLTDAAKVPSGDLDARRKHLSKVLSASLEFKVAQTPPPTAANAGRLAVTKSGIESPAVRQITRRAIVIERRTQQAIAAIELDDNTRSLIRRKVATDTTDREFKQMLSELRRSIWEDEKQNESEIRPQILRRVAAYSKEPLASVNEWVYANVLLTPRNDPWLGLTSKTQYIGIEGGGLHVPGTPPEAVSLK